MSIWCFRTQAASEKFARLFAEPRKARTAPRRYGARFSGCAQTIEWTAREFDHFTLSSSVVVATGVGAVAVVSAAATVGVVSVLGLR